MLAAQSTPNIEELAMVIAAYCARPATTPTTADLTMGLEVKRALINRLELDFALDAATLADENDEAVHMNPSVVSWLRERCHMTSAAAATAVTIGQHADQLTASAEAVVAGRVGLAHIGLIAYTAQAVEGAPAAAIMFDERRLVARAEVLSVQRFRTLCGHLRHAADREAFLAEQRQRVTWRTLQLTDCADGGMSISGFLDGEAGALVRTALEPLASRPTAGEERSSHAHRLADALVELCAHSLDTGMVPQRASQRSHLQVTTTLETLMDLTGAPAGEVEGGGLIAAASVQRLACDATITRVLVDAASAVIDVGRSQRVVPGATRRALNLRDGGCCWPGCDRTPSRCAAHHVVHWSKHGPTDLENLVLLCRRHHWSVHEGGWQLVRRDEGGIMVVPAIPDQLRRAA